MSKNAENNFKNEAFSRHSEEDARPICFRFCQSCSSGNSLDAVSMVDTAAVAAHGVAYVSS